MAYGRDGERTSSLAALIRVSATYELARREAVAIVDQLIAAIQDNWDDAIERVGLTKAQAESLYGSRVLNPSTIEGLHTVG